MRTSDRYAYLDTSAFVRLCWPEPESEALHSYLSGWPQRVSSVLLCTEALRAAQRQPATRIERTQRLLERMPMVEVDRSLFRQAGLLGPATMRSLDAVHVASALALGPDLGVVITYDERMAVVARLFGLDVASPA
ncbi:MAG TPA: type II toxin-antitoxin system VapC family toxin [Terriglobales bacterium]|nr:type II toxin-antitoxin system VapC family toxin [Terriglobales bacterium]